MRNTDDDRHMALLAEGEAFRLEAPERWNERLGNKNGRDLLIPGS